MKTSLQQCPCERGTPPALSSQLSGRSKVTCPVRVPARSLDADGMPSEASCLLFSPAFCTKNFCGVRIQIPPRFLRPSFVHGSFAPKRCRTELSASFPLSNSRCHHTGQSLLALFKSACHRTQILSALRMNRNLLDPKCPWRNTFLR